MEWSEYVNATRRTWNANYSQREQACNALLGLNGEVAEYIGDPGPEELGDVLFYLATVSRFMDIELEPSGITGVGSAIINACENEAPHVASTIAGGVAEQGKKHLFHDDPLEEVREGMCLFLDALMEWAEGHCVKKEWDFEEVLQQNIDKLKERYPDGFDPERK